MDQGTVELPKTGYASRFQFGFPAKKGSTQRKSRFHSGQHSLALKMIQLRYSRSCRILSFASCSVYNLQRFVQNNIIAWNQYNMYSQSHSFFPIYPANRPLRGTSTIGGSTLCSPLRCGKWRWSGEGSQFTGRHRYEWKMPPNWDLATSLIGKVDDFCWMMMDDVFVLVFLGRWKRGLQ